MTPHLLATPLSHFARKLRILLAELEVDYELSYLPSVLGRDPHAFADNPLMRVPAWRDDEGTWFESDHIARRVVARFDPHDRFGVRSERLDDLNRLAVISGIMANEVVLVLARRSGSTEVDSNAYFQKLALAIEGGLAWLDERITLAAPLDYRDMALVAMWQHANHYELVRATYPRIAARVAELAHRPSVAETAPEAALAAARASGWQPG